MRIKIDECLPGEIVELLTEIGHTAETVKDEGLTGSPDYIIWGIAQAENLFLITTDLDFSDIRRYTPGTHRGILLLRLSLEGKNYMLSYFKQLIANFDFNEWVGCVVIANDHKIRIKKPTGETS
jgi:predicted nuclease of predicted toxin-antitoxin system